MKYLVAILGLAGASAGAYLGLRRLDDLNSALGQAAVVVGEAVGLGAEVAASRTATYALLGCAAVGLVVSLMVARLAGGKAVNAVTLMVAGALPLFFDTDASHGLPMSLAGLMALGVTYAQPKA